MLKSTQTHLSTPFLRMEPTESQAMVRESTLPTQCYSVEKLWALDSDLMYSFSPMLIAIDGHGFSCRSLLPKSASKSGFYR